jgi:hypothetical protein
MQTHFYDVSVPAQFGLFEMLLCPKCGGENMHLGQSREGLTEDIYQDRTVEIDMWGECGHGATLSIYTHKGSTYARWHSVHDRPQDDDDDQGDTPHIEPGDSEPGDSVVGTNPDEDEKVV